MPIIIRTKDVRIIWFGKEVVHKISLIMRQRVITATTFLRNRVVQNISVPVVFRGNVVVERSLPGEYPRQETLMLKRRMILDFRETMKDVWDGFVGTPVDYGVKLELKMDRSFLIKSLLEEIHVIKRILTEPIK